MSNKDWLAIILSLLVVYLGLIGFAYFQFATRSPGQYVARYPDNTAATLFALERPNVSTKALLSWVTLAATATFTFDFVNFETQVDQLKNYFTNDGYANFSASLQNTAMLTTIQEKKLILSAVATGPAIVLTEEELGDKHSWRIQVPILVRYQSANVNETRQELVEVLVTQVPTSDAPKGIGIAQYNTREAGPELNS